MNIQATCQRISITNPQSHKNIKELHLRKNNNLCLKIVPNQSLMPEGVTGH